MQAYVSVMILYTFHSDDICNKFHILLIVMKDDRKLLLKKYGYGREMYMFYI